jgi:hypothetical protein
LATAFQGKSYELVLTKNGLGCIFGWYFHKLIWSPWQSWRHQKPRNNPCNQVAGLFRRHISRKWIKVFLSGGDIVRNRSQFYDFWVYVQLHRQRCIKIERFFPGADPTTSIFNASVVNVYNATGSLARFEKNLLWKTL